MPHNASDPADAGGRMLASRYRLGPQVGRGGMGTVWEARDEALGRDVAVKEVVLPHGLSDEDTDKQYKRTFREARTAARLGHPGVIAVYDVVEEDGRPWIVMELVRARSLAEVIKEDGPLGWRRVAALARQMLAALHAAHEAGVIHRDVKPSNVLVDVDRAVLTDFGIAHAVGDATLTTTGLVLGSPAYIAPERARGKDVGPASDLWSLGVTMYAMLDGRSPFERQEPLASLVAIISEDPVRPDGAGPLWPLIEGLLRKKAEERPTVHQAAQILDGLLERDGDEDESSTTVLPQGPPEVKKPGKAKEAKEAKAPREPREPGPGGNRAVIAAAVAVAVLAVAGLAIWLGNRSGGPAAHPPATPRGSASPSATTTTPGAVPAGYRLYTDPDGASAPIPDGWTTPTRWGNNSMHSSSPDNAARIEFSTASASGSPLDQLRAENRDHSQFSEVESKGTADTATLTYTWAANSGKTRVVIHAIKVGGSLHELLVQGPDAGWDAIAQKTEPVFAGYRVS